METMNIAHLDSQAKDLYTKIVELYGEELTAEDLEPLALYTAENNALRKGEKPTEADATRLYNDFADAYTGATSTEEIEDYYAGLPVDKGEYLNYDMWRHDMELYHTTLQGSPGHVYLFRD